MARKGNATASSHVPFSTVEISNTFLQEKVVHRAREGGHDRFAELLSEIYEKVSLIFFKNQPILLVYSFLVHPNFVHPNFVFHEKSKLYWQ